MLDQPTLTTLKQIIADHAQDHDHRFFVFGSRAAGTARKYSDIDIGIEGNKPLDLTTFFSLESAFEDSDLPYRVDLVDFSQITPRFKRIAEKKAILNLS